MARFNPPNTTMPGEWCICDTCDGHGSHSQHLGAYTSSEFDEAFGTPEEQEDYMSGAYDRPCHSCNGTGKVWDVDVSRCTFGQKRLLVEQRRTARWDREAYEEQKREAQMMGEWS
jgi:DnaJ-class molecular chaperone